MSAYQKMKHVGDRRWVLMGDLRWVLIRKWNMWAIAQGCLSAISDECLSENETCGRSQGSAYQIIETISDECLSDNETCGRSQGSAYQTMKHVGDRKGVLIVKSRWILIRKWNMWAIADEFLSENEIRGYCKGVLIRKWNKRLLQGSAYRQKPRSAYRKMK